MLLLNPQDSRRGNVHCLVGKVSEAAGGRGRCQDHTDAWREALKEQLLQEGGVYSRSLLSQKLLDSAEHLCRLLVSELLRAKELLLLTLLGGCSLLYQLLSKGSVGVISGWLDDEVSDF